MRIDIAAENRRESLAGWFLTEALAQQKHDDIVDEIRKQGAADVRLTINGREMDVRTVFDLMQEQYADAIERAESEREASTTMPTIRDRFAIALVTGKSIGNESPEIHARGAKRVYDLAEALDAERRQRGGEDGR